MTGSGDITAEQIGQGDVKAETGSGNIEIKDIHGGFRAHWLTATAIPPHTMSCFPGTVRLRASSRVFSPVTIGSANGGGPTVHAQTGSGDIHVF
ncbi:MAG: hypothetical protein ACLPH3_03375 [Terracidiphilus sp.]